MNTNPVYWRMRNGVLISVDDMDINHLRNTLKMLIRNANKPVKKPDHFLNNFIEEAIQEIENDEYDYL